MKTDVQIQNDVLSELRWAPYLSDAEVGVAVKNGVVTLSGTVDSYAKKRAAEKAAMKVSGVTAVAEDIEVKLFATSRKNDTQIAEAVVNALRWNTMVDDKRIQVKVEDGWVTLKGEAEWEFQKKSAKDCIEDLNGVRGITNLIDVKPSIKMSDVQEKIRAAFERHANLDASRVKVETNGSKVTLSGTVRSLAEKNDAEDAAWAAPGVSFVENNIEVSYAAVVASY